MQPAANAQTPASPTAAPASTAPGGKPIKPAGERVEPSLRRLPKAQFGYAQARHLLWRAGFGGTESQIRLLVSWGPDKSVDHLLAAGTGDDLPAGDAFDKNIMRSPTAEEREMYRRAQQEKDEELLAKVRVMREQRQKEDRLQMQSLSRWWLARLIETPRPLEEKMTLFWHGVLATNYRAIENSYHMFQQNMLLRKHALGSYADLLHALIRDPAMLAYLNNNQSRKGKPNENLAREIMELFSLGVGNYTERDIKEGARALTGYTFEDDQFEFQQKNHDAGAKTILGNSGNFDGDDFVNIILAQSACPRYLARRLYGFFVGDVPTEERGGEAGLESTQRTFIHTLADVIKSNQYQLSPALRALFLSEHFYSPRFMNQQIKSPVVLAVGAVRSLNCPVRDLSVIDDALDRMGQRLFFPPSVKGWEGGRTWMNTSTFFVRQNLLAFLLTGKRPQGFDPTAETEKFDPVALLEGEEPGGVARNDADAVAEKVLMVTLGWTPEAPKRALIDFARSAGGKLDSRVLTGMLLLATALPEYQLC